LREGMHGLDHGVGSLPYLPPKHWRAAGCHATTEPRTVRNKGYRDAVTCLIPPGSPPQVSLHLLNFRGVPGRHSPAFREAFEVIRCERCETHTKRQPMAGLHIARSTIVCSLIVRLVGSPRPGPQNCIRSRRSVMSAVRRRSAPGYCPAHPPLCPLSDPFDGSCGLARSRLVSRPWLAGRHTSPCEPSASCAHTPYAVPCATSFLLRIFSRTTGPTMTSRFLRCTATRLLEISKGRNVPL